MSSEKLMIRDVVFAVPTGKQDSGYITQGQNLRGKIFVEFEVVNTGICVIDEQRSKAISIETGEVFDIMRRDESGRIVSHEIEKIHPNHLIVLRVLEIKKNKASLLNQRKLKPRAKEVYRSYLETVSQNEKGVSYTKRKVQK